MKPIKQPRPGRYYEPWNFAEREVDATWNLIGKITLVLIGAIIGWGFIAPYL